MGDLSTTASSTGISGVNKLRTTRGGPAGPIDPSGYAKLYGGQDPAPVETTPISTARTDRQPPAPSPRESPPVYSGGTDRQQPAPSTNRPASTNRPPLPGQPGGAQIGNKTGAWKNPQEIIGGLEAQGKGKGWREMSQALAAAGFTGDTSGDPSRAGTYGTNFSNDVRHGHLRAYGANLWAGQGNNADGTKTTTIVDNNGNIVEQRPYDATKDQAGVAAGQARQQQLYQTLAGLAGVTGGGGTGGAPPSIDPLNPDATSTSQTTTATSTNSTWQDPVYSGSSIASNQINAGGQPWVQQTGPPDTSASSKRLTFRGSNWVRDGHWFVPEWVANDPQIDLGLSDAEASPYQIEKVNSNRLGFSEAVTTAATEWGQRSRGRTGLAAGGVVAMPRPGGVPLDINGVPTQVAEAGQAEAVMPLSTLQDTISQAAQHGAQIGVQQARGQQARIPLARGGVIATRSNRGLPGMDGTATSGPLAPRPADEDQLDDGRTSNGVPEAPSKNTLIKPTAPGAYDDIYGGGGDFGAGGTFTPGAYTPYQAKGMPADQQAQLSAITEMARSLKSRGEGLYNVGSDAYGKAVNYYKALTAGNRGAMTAAVAPSAELIREQSEGAKSGVTANLGRGGARDAALAGIGSDTAGEIARLTAGVQGNAASALGQLGGQGIGQGQDATNAAIGANAQVQQSLAQHYQFETGLGENSSQFAFAQSEQGRQFAASLAEQVRQGNMTNAQATAALKLSAYQAEQDYGLKVAQFEEQMRQFNEQMKQQNLQYTKGLQAQSKANSGAMWGTIIGVAGMAIVAL